MICYNMLYISTRTKIFESSNSLIVLKSEIILMRSFGKSNQQFNLKRKFSVSSSDPKKTQFLMIYNINGIKLLNRLRLHFSRLYEHNFRHNFRATIDSMCSCGLEPGTTHYITSCFAIFTLNLEQSFFMIIVL